MNNQTMYEGKKSKVAWLLALIIGIVPLIVRMKDMKLPEVAKDIWDAGGSGIYADFFSANKVVALGLLTLIAVILFSVEYIRAKPYQGTKLEIPVYKNKLVYTCLGIYMVFVLLSTLLVVPQKRIIALIGAPGRYEGFVALALYVLIMILAMQVAQEWWNIKLIYKVLTVGAFIMGLIGLGQFLGFDIFQTDGGKSLILPFEYLHMAGQVNFTMGTSASRVYTTVFNPNYVGSYSAMLMPISVVGMIYAYTYNKSTEKKINATIFSVLMIILWMINNSRGGLVGGGIALALIFILLHKHLLKTKSHAVIFISLVLVGIVGLNMFGKGSIKAQVISLSNEVSKIFLPVDSNTSQLSDIRVNANGIEIDSNLPTFRLEKEEKGLVMKNEEGDIVPLLQEEAKITPQDEAYPGMSLTEKTPNQWGLYISNPDQGRNYAFDLVYTAEGFRGLASNGELFEFETVKSWGFEGKERMGSSRGYIWSRTIPMIGEKWLLGYGPDTYLFHFPQNDIVGKLNAYGTTKMITDKPHNLYLQAAVSTGVPSLLVLILLFGFYCIQWVKHIRRTDTDDIRRWMSIGIFVALCGYLVAGMFNDSVVSVAPIFWVLWGLGIGLTQKEPEQLVNKKK